MSNGASAKEIIRQYIVLPCLFLSLTHHHLSLNTLHLLLVEMGVGESTVQTKVVKTVEQSYYLKYFIDDADT